MSHVDSQVQRMWWWRSHGQRRRIDDSDPGSRAPRPTHLTPNPSLHVIHTTFNLHKHDPCWAQERRWREGCLRGTEEDGKRRGGGCLTLHPAFSTPRLLLVQVGAPLPEMHSSVGHCGLKLWHQGSQWKHSDRVDDYHWVFCFFRRVWMCIVLFVLGLLLFFSSVTCCICCCW